jgi:hypothetical protein
MSGTSYHTLTKICSDFLFHTRCLAHVINLATQAYLLTYSKALHFDPADSSTHEPNDLTADMHDEVGLVRVITVKVSRFLYSHLKTTSNELLLSLLGSLISKAISNVSKHANER